MTNRVTDPLLVEWLVFYLLAGVEHFYLFDNSPTSKHHNNEGGNLDPLRLLRPFLDAELVTLISLPYIAEKHWDAIQSASAQISLQQFGKQFFWATIAEAVNRNLVHGRLITCSRPLEVKPLSLRLLFNMYPLYVGHYSEWMGLFDQDEFLLPMSPLKKRQGDFTDPTFLAEVLQPLKVVANSNGVLVDTILFNTLEMSCGRLRDPRRPPLYLTFRTQEEAMKALPAVTTQCTEKGIPMA